MTPVLNDADFHVHARGGAPEPPDRPHGLRPVPTSKQQKLKPKQTTDPIRQEPWAISNEDRRSSWAPCSSVTPAREVKEYDYRPAFGSATQLGLYTGLAGTIAGAINHGVISPSEGNRGYITNVTKFGAMAAAVGFTFGGVSQFVASVREESDPWNAASGGCAAGFLLGIRTGYISTALGQCAIGGAVAGGVNYAGDTLIPANHGKTRAQQQQERVKQLGQKDPLLLNRS
ncbi:hypothetical protein PSTT_06148 [Puccinia striiformis]|uniref:Uncharacterized protein n=1 Tax=Puccinia striiformis TaxID=27350 RepID=A0A2S4VL79_9BASI|nr:hypothetical protein PSTT_06148 [Puccinia striiformis]